MQPDFVTRDGGQLPTRRAAIIRLVETRDEHLPEPSGRSESVAGFVHREKATETCPDCLANDRVMFGCETCRGRGTVEVYRERDPYSITEQTTKYGLDGSRHDAAYARDRQIEALQRQTRPALSEAELLAEANRDPYAWERARARMYRLYDYASLDRAMEWLRSRFPGARSLSNFTLGYLDVVLPDPLRAPGIEPDVRVRGPLQRGGGAGLDARELRDADMRARAKELVDLRLAPTDVTKALADEFRVSVRTVYRVVNEAA